MLMLMSVFTVSKMFHDTLNGFEWNRHKLSWYFGTSMSQDGLQLTETNRNISTSADYIDTGSKFEVVEAESH